MSLELIGVLVFGFLLGVGVGWWRCYVYCRKLLHFGVNLDEWAHYDPAIMQARGQGRPHGRPLARVD